MRNWRDVVAHVATPWEWRSRGRVVALVVVAVVGTFVTVAWWWLVNDARIGAVILNGGISALIWLFPALRCLDHWDERHGPGTAR